MESFGGLLSENQEDLWKDSQKVKEVKEEEVFMNNSSLFFKKSVQKEEGKMTSRQPEMHQGDGKFKENKLIKKSSGEENYRKNSFKSETKSTKSTIPMKDSWIK